MVVRNENGEELHAFLCPDKDAVEAAEFAKVLARLLGRLAVQVFRLKPDSRDGSRPTPVQASSAYQAILEVYIEVPKLKVTALRLGDLQPFDAGESSALISGLADAMLSAGGIDRNVSFSCYTSPLKMAVNEHTQAALSSNEITMRPTDSFVSLDPVPEPEYAMTLTSNDTLFSLFSCENFSSI